MTFILGTIENGADTIPVDLLPNPPSQWVDQTEILAEECLAAQGVPPSTSSVLRRQPTPGVAVVALDPNITDPLGIKVSILPSQGFLLFIDWLPSEAHTDIADIIFSNCKVACFNFYQFYGLYRTKFGYDDDSSAWKLFQVSDSPGRAFPQTANDLSLEQWTSKLVHAHSRIGAEDTIYRSHLNDWDYSKHVFKHFPQITILVDPWGKLKVDVVEKCLVYSLALCQVLKRWDSLDRLKALWDAIHRPESPSINKTLLMPPSSAYFPLARYEHPGVDEEEDHRPSKRARVEEDSDQSDGISDRTSESSEESRTTPDPEQDDA
ncbi:hypothetical protein QBC32DRAFT_223540 [Pseudoneurospora amorphoporcata]|uniref:Uncharacterized protein n=1 Tax=Pseudoneurospora amorphoporcata TaxID=241081 RepID=A0AAN6SBP4_9PEZI|nr:hypothetical protein QBC32DRAFT_223540 [Pseudoneurospora amorphoporcata]